MGENVLKVFEGLTDEQAKELRRRIIGILPELRREVVKVNGMNAKIEGDKKHYQRTVKNDNEKQNKAT